LKFINKKKEGGENLKVIHVTKEKPRIIRMEQHSVVMGSSNVLPNQKLGKQTKIQIQILLAL
jgi:hypothetical protein